MNSIMSLVALPGKRACLVETRGFFRRALLIALAAAFSYCALAAGAKADIRFVQQNYAVPHPSGSPVQITYTNAQTAGNLNIVVVGWNDITATVWAVTDSAGNTYQLAVGPTTFSGATNGGGNLSQSIYYAANIRGAGAGANTVKVTFSQAAIYPDIRVLEYSGIVASSPIDGTAASVGNSAISSSGAPTAPTTNPNDLIFGANTVYTYTNGPGTGFTNRVITNPDGNIAEDMIAASPGSYSATVPLCCAGSWVMQMVAFKGTATGPLLTGKWTTQATLAPVNPVHAALLKNGKILLVAGSGNCPPSQSGCPKSGPYSAYVYDPVAGTLAQNTQITWDMFCNGASLLADGRVLFAGGTLQYDPFYGARNAAIFDPSKPVASAFTNVASMANGRWYPTLTTLGNGQVMAVSGLDKNGNGNNTVELYNGSSWILAGNTQSAWALYPRLHLLPNGQVFYSGPNSYTYFITSSTDTWSYVAQTNYGKANNGNYRTYDTSVLLPLTWDKNFDPKVMIMGGDNPATNTTEIIDLNNPAAGWQWGPPMSQPRIEMNAVILPTGKILAVGGSTYDEDATHASLNADLYDPMSNTFSSAGANTYPRLYHSVALLLPDATVWLAGGNPQRGTYEKHMEIYQPPYLFTGAARPVISNAPASISFSHPAQNPFQVTLQTPTAPSSIASVVLVRMGAVTHAFNTDQRLVGFKFAPTPGSSTMLDVTLPSSSSYPGLLPPGYYMLFVVNTSGVPSQAWIMQVQL